MPTLPALVAVCASAAAPSKKPRAASAQRRPEDAENSFCIGQMSVVSGLNDVNVLESKH
jgi:hypothetical protein